MEQTSQADDDGATDWPLHQRLAGVVVRTLAVGLAIAPVAALRGEHRGIAAAAVGLSLVLAFPLLALERRDVSVAGALLRLLLGVAIGVVLIPVAVVSFQNVGRPDLAFHQLDRLLDWRTIVSLVIAAPLLAALLGVLFAVRVRTSRVTPQVLAGLLIPLSVISGWAEQLAWSADTWPQVLPFVVSGALLPVALVGAERVMSRRDPRAPRPVERDPRPCFAVFGVVLLVLGLIPAIALRAVSSMTWMPEHHADGAGIAEETAHTLRLLSPLGRGGWTSTDDAGWTNEPRDGHLVRVLVAPGGLHWSVAVDSLDPATTHPRSWVGDHTGALVSYSAPVAIDPSTFLAPSGGSPQ